MHFTREPIIETVVTARDGYNLTVRSTKTKDREEYTVEAVEIVSFGSAQFFRSLEKPHAFLLPTSDFELCETKETRVLLKGVSFEKSIKIGGGREAFRVSKEVVEEIKETSEPSSAATEGKVEVPASPRHKDRKRHRRRRANEERNEMKRWGEQKKTEEETLPPEEKDKQSQEVAQHTPLPLLGTLIPPPTTLVSKSLARYKDSLVLEVPIHNEHVNEPTRDKNEEEASLSSSRIYLVTPEEGDPLI